MENILLIELIEQGQITDEAASFCKTYDLLNLSLIVNFFLSEENSNKIENISYRIRTNLKNLCRQYLYSNVDQSSLLTMPLQQLSIVESMSQRTINVCHASDLTTLQSILKYRWEHSNFLRQRNCGFKSNKELIQICDKYDNLILNGSIVLNDITIDTTGTEIKYKIIEESTSIDLLENIDLNTLAEIENMTIRSFNVCLKADLTSLRLILQYYLDSKGKNFLQIRSCGKQSNNELINICHKYGRNIIGIKKVQKKEEDHFSPVEKFLSNLRLKSSDYNNLKIILLGHQYLPVFTMLNLLIDSHFIFRKENHTQIFKSSFNCYLPITNLTLDVIGKQLGLTRERVRQIREKLLRQINNTFHSIRNIDQEIACPSYIKTPEQPIILISNEDANVINQSENTNFSALFISFILGMVYNESYSWFGDKNILFSNNIFRKSCLITHSYLIRRDIAYNFQFDRFLKYIKSIVFQTRRDELIIPYNELIRKFKGGEPEDYQGTVSAIQTILSNEFNNSIGLSPDGIILFQNTKKTLLSYIVEILQNSYKPLHYTEIHQQLVCQGVRVKSDKTTHAMLNRENSIFGLKGAGIFDLRSKGGLFGSIGDVAKQILYSRNEPIPISELENLICKELIVSKDSIVQVLFNYEPEVRFEKDRSGNVKLKEWQKLQPVRAQEQIQLELF